MSILKISESRSVIPRWRRSSTFDNSPESIALTHRATSAEFQGWFDRSYRDWLEARTPGYLADALSAAIVEGQKSYFRELAMAVLDFGDAVPSALQILAKTILDPDVRAQQQDHMPQMSASPEVLARSVSHLRSRIGSMPRNAFLWHDLSYSYLLLGEIDKAERAMATSLGVSDHHRLIARSAARLFVHNKSYDRALRTLSAAPAFRYDPWLLSAHIAISQGVFKSSPHLKRAKALLDSSEMGVQTSELGMALATEELLHGKLKKAKILARNAGATTTENSLAQGVWLSRQLNSELVTEDIASAVGAFEAQAWDAYYKGDWDSTLAKSLLWLEDQPFSSRPAALGSFVASTFVRNFPLCEEIARFSLRTNPGDWLLTNNLAVALAEQDRLTEADVEFSRLEVPGEGTDFYAVWLATSGLLRYRSGDQETGRLLYARAYEASRLKRDRSAQLLSSLYQSMEEARIGDTDFAAALLKKAQDDLGPVERRDKEIVNLLQLQIAELHADRTGASKS